MSKERDELANTPPTPMWEAMDCENVTNDPFYDEIKRPSPRFTHADHNGDALQLYAGTLGAVITAHDRYAGEEISVAVRAEDLPALIEALESILNETAA